MAATKSIPRKSGSHARPTRTREALPKGPRQRLRGEQGATGDPRSNPRQSAGEMDGTPRDRAELTERLSSALALTETVAMALRKFESDPALGSICMALDQAIAVLDRAHAGVDLFLNKAHR